MKIDRRNIAEQNQQVGFTILLLLDYSC